MLLPKANVQQTMHHTCNFRFSSITSAYFLTSASSLSWGDSKELSARITCSTLRSSFLREYFSSRDDFLVSPALLCEGCYINRGQDLLELVMELKHSVLTLFCFPPVASVCLFELIVSSLLFSFFTSFLVPPFSTAIFSEGSSVTFEVTLESSLRGGFTRGVS